MVRVRLERFSPETLKQLHARHVGAYSVLRRSVLMPTSSTPPMILESTRCSTLRTWLFTALQWPIRWSYLMSQHRLPGVPAVSSLATITTTTEEAPTEEIEGILIDETVSTADGTYHHYLVCWRGRLDSNCTWLRAKEIMQLNPELLHDFHRHFPEANFSKSGRVDGNLSSTGTRELSAQ